MSGARNKKRKRRTRIVKGLHEGIVYCASFRGGHIYRPGWRELGRHLVDLVCKRPVPTAVFVVSGTALDHHATVELHHRPMKGYLYDTVLRIQREAHGG